MSEPAGRRLDYWVHMWVMGEEEATVGISRMPMRGYEESYCEWAERHPRYRVPHYSEDFADAGRVIGRIGKVFLNKRESANIWHCSFDGAVLVAADTGPHAVSQAALVYKLRGNGG